MSKIKNRFYKDRDAVSEIVGTILILSITVVLFASIFATVSLMETPEQRTYIDFETSFVREEDDYLLKLTHKGGRTLEKFNTAFNIAVYDGTYRSTRYEHDSVNLTFPGDMWGIGEEAVIDIGDLPDRLGYNDWTHMLNQIDVADILVMDTGRNDLIWRTEFRLGDPGKRVVIKDMGVEYPYEWENFVEAGSSVRLYARIGPSDLLNDIEVTIDLSSLLGYEGTFTMVRDGGDRFVYPPPEDDKMDIDSDQENDTYHLRVEAEYGGSEENVRDDNVNIILNVGPLGASLDQPFIHLDANKINFNPTSPVNGENVQIYAVVENSGGSPAVCDVNVYGNHTRDLEPALIHTFENVSLAAGGGRDLFHTWTIKDSGTHNISLNATDITWHGGEYNRPEPEAYKFLYVQPTILLVDDVRGDGEDASLMYGDLEATASHFDHHIVDNTHRPSLEILQRYDIIIWMSGSQTTNTLTEEDQDNLAEVMENGTSLWLIGANIFEDLGYNNEFITDYLKTVVEAGNIPDGNVHGNTIPLEPLDEFEVLDDEYYGNYLTPADADIAAKDGAGNTIAVSYEDDVHGYRSMYNSFLFSSMEGMPGDPDAQPRTNMVYKVINWLGGVEFKGGNDVAVAEQKFSTATPKYMEWVTIDAVIRNNGMENLTDVEVRLQVNGEVLENNATTIANLEGMGGTQRVEFGWLAEEVGRHEVLVVADPFNYIEEINKENNDIRYKGVNVHVTVRFSVLVVDDDHTDSNTTAYVTESLERLGYAYEVHTVASVDDPGPDVDKMNLFNSVYWVCGHSTATLLDTDINAITDYLYETTGTSFLLIGNHVPNDLQSGPIGGSDFLRDIMGIDPDSVEDMDNFPERMIGTNNDPIGHGLAYDTDDRGQMDPYTFDVLDADIFLTDGNGNNIASRYDSGQFKTALLGVDMFHMEGPVYEDTWYTDFDDDVDTSPEATRQELVYMMSKWFGNVDDRIELRVSSVDIVVENRRPVLGRSYLITVDIHNIGFRETSALVRFKDGFTLIGSESIYVPGDGMATAELTWKPLYAGPERPIRVIADPLCNVEEISNETTDIDHMGFNNHAKIRLPVYYFWDDMENGTANWRTEATIMNINAEHPLEFLTEEHEKAYTDIISMWDEDASKYLNVTDNFSYSDPRSYWLEEPIVGEDEEIIEDVQVPIDVVLVIDTSGSMDWDDDGNYVGPNDPDSRMYQAREAAKDFIQTMNDTDRAAIITFHDQYNEEAAFMTETNKQDFIDTLDTMDGNGGTPFYDACGEGIEYIISDQFTIDSGNPSGDIETDPDCSDISRLEFVIALGDGESNQDDEYSPKANWGETTNDGGGDSGSGDYSGLLKAPPMVFTIGVVSNTLHPSYSTYPEANQDPNWSHNWTDYSNDYYEEEMWSVADQSCWPWGKYGRDFNKSSHGYHAMGEFNNPDPHIGHYYFAESAQDIGNVFTNIRNIIGSISEQAGKSADAGNVTSIGDGNTIRSDGGGSGVRSTGGEAGLMAVQPGPSPMATSDYYPQDNNWWTGRVYEPSSGWGRYDGDMRAGVYDFNYVNGWAKFDISGLPDSASIDNVVLHLYVNYDNGDNIDTYIKQISNDPVPADANDLYADTEDGNNYGSMNFGSDTGWQTLDLANTANTDLQNQLISDWFAIGIDTDTANGRNNYITFDGHGDTNEPYITVTYTVQTPPSITITDPNGGETWQAGTTHDITWTTTEGDNPIDYVDLYYSTDSGGTWTLIAANEPDDGVYLWIVPNDPSTNCLVGGVVYDTSGLWGSDTSDATFTITEGPPTVLKAYPTIDNTAIPSQYVGVIFDKTMETTETPTLTQTGGDEPDGGYMPEGWFSTYQPDDTFIWSHEENWTAGNTVTLEVSDFTDADGDTQTTPYSWSFNMLIAGGGSGGIPSGKNYNKTAVTPAFDLTGYSTARLTFWHKYNIVPGTNGAFLQVGFEHEGEWKWRYVIPTHGSYTGNMNMSAERLDDFDRRMDWAWNGVSGGGSFAWDYVQVNLLPYIDDEGGSRENVRVRFNYTQYGSGTGYGWFFDDVKLTVSRAPNAPITDNMKDVWRQVNTTGHDGQETTAWWNGEGEYDEDNPSWFLKGIDNSLVSSPIDLTGARTVFLEAYFKFNINNASGAPPDGFRVEVTMDGGRVWMPINSGVRTASGVYDWTSADDLDRLNVDLSDFRGNVIRIRFRVFTCNAAGYDPFEDDTADFGGFYVDNVIVSGRTIQEG